MLLDEIARTSEEVAGTSARNRKTALIADSLRALRPEEVPVAVAYLAGELPQGSVGVGWASLRSLPPPAPEPTLELLDVDAAIGRIASVSGKGSQALRKTEVAQLFGRATEREQRFLRSLLLGELRQGALEGVMLDAVAKAADVPGAEVRRAAMLAGDLREVAAAALGGDERGLDRFRLTVLRPVKPMLAQTAEDLESALAKLTPRPRSSGSSTERGFRCTGSATRCARIRGTSPTSPSACRRSSRRCSRYRSSPSSSTGRRSR